MNKRIDMESVYDMRTGRVDDGCRRYGVGRNTMREIGKAAKAEIRFGKSVLYNFGKIDAYMDQISE